MTNEGSSGGRRQRLQRCPRCGSRDLRRSATRRWERPVRWFTNRVPFRCRSCDYRCWGLDDAAPEQNDSSPNAADA